LIRKTLHDKGVLFSFYEVAWAQRKFDLSLGLGCAGWIGLRNEMR